MSSIGQIIQHRFPRGPIYEHVNKSVDSISEQNIRRLGWVIRSKPNWVEDLNGLEKVVEWQKAAKAQKLTEREVEYLYGELAYYQKLCKEAPPGVVLSAVEKVWQSDEAVDCHTSKTFRDHVKVLEDIPAKLKDWQTGKKNQVLLLIDPSLYPIMYECTPILSYPITEPQAALDVKSFGTFHEKLDNWDVYSKYGIPEVVDSEGGFQQNAYIKRREAEKYLSRSSCWLPTDFRVAEDGTVTIESYINNLHPVKHAQLYPVIANIFSKFIPLLEQVVTDMCIPYKRRVNVCCYTWYGHSVERPERPYGRRRDSYEWEEYHYALIDWRDSEYFDTPQPGKFEPPNRPVAPYSLKNKRLQAVVKMTNIQLAPKKPEYKGDIFQVDGLTNERIVATGIYYYDVENITESRLNFVECSGKTTIGREFRDDGYTLGYAFGVGKGKPYVQDIGYVTANEGRCLVYPNIYQHQESGFKLADPKKPGHCKMLIFYFVDPSTTIPSTRYVPPQQQEWWSEKVMDTNKGGQLAMLPELVKDNIIKHVNFPIPLKEAKKHRQEQLKEYNSKFKPKFKQAFTPFLDVF